MAGTIVAFMGLWQLILTASTAELWGPWLEGTSQVFRWFLILGFACWTVVLPMFWAISLTRLRETSKELWGQLRPILIEDGRKK